MAIASALVLPQAATKAGISDFLIQTLGIWKICLHSLYQDQQGDCVQHQFYWLSVATFLHIFYTLLLLLPSPAWAEDTVLSLCVCVSECYHKIAVNFNYLKI